GIVLDCSRHLHRVLEVNAEERWARVQPGCVLDDLNREVQPLGLHFPIDISTSDRATLGGMIANNSSGTHSVVYGKTIDHVLELRVVLADGSVVQLGPLGGAQRAARRQQPAREGEGYRPGRRLAPARARHTHARY